MVLGDSIVRRVGDWMGHQRLGKMEDGRKHLLSSRDDLREAMNHVTIITFHSIVT